MDAKGFLYVLAYADHEAEIAALELAAMTGAGAEGRLATHLLACDVAAASYTRLVLRVLVEAEEFAGLLDGIAALGLATEGFAVDVLRVTPKPDLDSMQAAKAVADLIAGWPNLTTPRQRYAVVATRGRCWFGPVVSARRGDWHEAAGQPAQFSNSLPPRLARALVNMVAVPGDTLVDPCCGVGTVLVEAALLGVRSEGYDLSWPHVAQARANLEYHGVAVQVRHADAAALDGRWDAAVIDLPYGHTSVADDDLYRRVVGNIARRVKRLAVVTGGDKAYLWDELGLTIRGLAHTPCTNLVRHSYLLSGRATD